MSLTAAANVRGMTNEELVSRIQAGETALMATLWGQAKRYAFRSANKFYYLHYDRCAEMGVELMDLEQEAYLAIHKAVEKFKAEKGVKFLTYAEYRLKQRFHIAAKLHNGGHHYHEAKFDDMGTSNEGGECDSLEYLIADPRAEAEIDDISEREYQQQYQATLRATIQDAFDGLNDRQRNTVIACLVHGLSCRAYASQAGMSRQTICTAKNEALRNLRVNTQLAAFAVA